MFGLSRVDAGQDADDLWLPELSLPARLCHGRIQGRLRMARTLAGLWSVAAGVQTKTH
jgi:hypothetical protein